MKHDPHATRRRMLRLTGAAAVAGLAGCTGSGNRTDDQADSGATPSPTSTASDHQEEGQHHDDHGHNHDEGTPQEPSATATVSMRTEGSGQHYAPHAVWIEPGGSVTWELESGSHDVTAYHPDNDRSLRMPEAADPWSTKLLSEEGATVERIFETEGVYDYFCTPHEAVGMVGTVIVGEPGPHDQPGLEEPDSSLPEGAGSELADLNGKVNEALGHTH